MPNPDSKGRPPILWECWGEKKSAREWVEDPRCEHDSPREIGRRVKKHGWTVEDAITKPLKGSRKAKAARAKREAEEKAEKGETFIGRSVLAWGLRKNMSEWCEEPFVQISVSTLYRRLKKGWKPEAALMGEPFESRRSAHKKANTPPWDLPLSEFLKLTLSIGT